ncbi:MAG: methyltransferase domain-containing protein [Candidatus Brockarchaeota archaeon]|nr:methyltransferase domain-containing protein [Candidatus Brockarchaeota archaeon]
MRFLLVFPSGLEDVVKSELEEKTSFKIVVEENPQGIAGRLIIDIPESDSPKLLSLRSIDWFMEYVGAFKVDASIRGLEDVYSGIMSMKFPNGFRESSSFRVTCKRRGEHEFTSMDVQRKAGQALVDKYGLKVDLENFQANVFLDIVGDTCFVGLSGSERLSGRYIVFTHPAALRPSVAYGMVRIADPKPGMTLLDPMCGGGIIPIEAALSTNGVKIYGFDISEYYLEGAALNAEAMGVSDRIVFKRVDCRRLSKELRFKADRIVTDPPYGTKPIAKINPRAFYSRCLPEIRRALSEDGRLVLITIKPGYVREISSEIGLCIEHERTIRHGDASPSIMVLKSS